MFGGTTSADDEAVPHARHRIFLHLVLAVGVLRRNLKPRFYPPDNRAATHAVIAAQLAGLDALRLSHAILRALWAEERNSADRATLIAIAGENGMDGARLFAADTTAAVEREFARNSAEAVARGVFGSPTYYFAGVPYWGQDRLDFLDRALAAAGV
ncbi:MAG: DsbA family protein [Betaproteobacteria bacterium]|nr:DsbA family protein [Betaproteobacteria bacterium]